MKLNRLEEELIHEYDVWAQACDDLCGDKGNKEKQDRQRVSRGWLFSAGLRLAEHLKEKGTR